MYILFVNANLISFVSRNKISTEVRIRFDPRPKYANDFFRRQNIMM